VLLCTSVSLFCSNLVNWDSNKFCLLLVTDNTIITVELSVTNRQNLLESQLARFEQNKETDVQSNTLYQNILYTTAMDNSSYDESQIITSFIIIFLQPNVFTQSISFQRIKDLLLLLFDD